MSAAPKGAVLLVGGPFDGKEVPLSAMERTMGHPRHYFLRIDDAESAVYANISPSSLGYLYTISDQ